MKYKTISILVAVVLFLVLLIQNTQVVNINLYLWEISMPQIVLIFLSIVVGFIGGYVSNILIEKRRSGGKK